MSVLAPTDNLTSLVFVSCYNGTGSVMMCKISNQNATINNKTKDKLQPPLRQSLHISYNFYFVLYGSRISCHSS